MCYGFDKLDPVIQYVENVMCSDNFDQTGL